MITKYNTEIDNEFILNNLKRLINQTYKLLPNREEGLEWKTPLSTIIEELAGMRDLFCEELGSDMLSLMCKLEGLNSIDENDFFSFRRTIFETLNLMNKVKDYVGSR
jgi:hypothetical protein